MLANAVIKEKCCLGGGLYEISFELNWQGAWKNEVNNDGVYIFMKYSNKNEYGYHSAKLVASSDSEYDGTDKSPEYLTLDNADTGAFVPDTRLGFFVYPINFCSKKSMNTAGIVRIQTDGNIDDIVIFAIEMVYIPNDCHYVGDSANGISRGGTLKNCLFTYPDKGAYLIKSEDEIKFAPEENCLYCEFDTPNGRQQEDFFIIPKEFPKGFKSMWYMKYSLTEKQYVQFINCLTRQQQQAHVMSDISFDTIDNYYVMTNTDKEKDRAAVVCRRTGNGTEAPVEFFTAAENRSINAISYDDVSAFACFAGLRLITELEYEKACRGPLPAVSGEFAWGTTEIGRVFHFSGTDGSGTEIPLSQAKGVLCNCNFGTGIAPFEREMKNKEDNPGWEGPVSAGVFSNGEILDGHSERECIGASYYGVMELCGNVWENLVTIGREEGRTYDGEHGNGYLDENGHHTMSSWPRFETGAGIGVRGGVFVSPNPDYVRMALRVFAAHTKNDKRYHGGLRVGF